MRVKDFFKKLRKQDEEQPVLAQDMKAKSRQSVVKKENKRKTLVYDFRDVVEQGNLQELQNVFQRCDINAYDTFTKNNALSFYGLSKDAIHWLVEQGCDLNYIGRWGKTPLHCQASYRGSHLALFLSLGANVNQQNDQGDTPLHVAASNCIVEHVRDLLSAGAKVRQKNHNGETPLEEMLVRADGLHLPEAVEIAELLLRHGENVRKTMKQSVERIGKDIEFYRCDPAACDEAALQRQKARDEALRKLYRMFHVKPVRSAKRMKSGECVTVQSNRWQQQHQELWEQLVPANGAADTLQGEVLRISGKLSYELLDNGGMNWDREYQKMVQAMKKYVCAENGCTKEEIQEIHKTLSACKGGMGGEGMERLCEVTVAWILRNPDLIPLDPPSYKR
ncbi:ankyrin repeat domain-containing protein [[Clostridium] innocuum]|uniref:ankyrin repeat domain-containing protein n=1 Tax=Clostridium innocuum TaxID=1522 RepID=UPI00214722F5|nr:ankyrin repeat domain-containing protein [[Clostridium] innocuum]MCR0271972.1 ankyrin repeat domain-containing protein [[Clostridium] innocuum]